MGKTQEHIAIFERGEIERKEFIKLAIKKGFLYEMRRSIGESLWKPAYLKYIGCPEGCLDYLGMDVCMAWLCENVGHVLIVNIHDIKCPEGPTAWGDADLKYMLKHETDNNIAKGKYIQKRESVWEELNSLLNEVYPAIAGSGLSPSFMSSLAKMINNVILQIQGKKFGKKGNSPILKLGYWRSTLS